MGRERKSKLRHYPTATYVDTGTRKLVVTNSHVYRSFQKLRQNEPSLAMFLAGSAPNAVLELDESSKVASRRFRVDDEQTGNY